MERFFFFISVTPKSPCCRACQYLQLSLHVYYTLIMWGYILHTETKTQTWADIPHMHTQGSKIQSWKITSCPTENNHRQIHFEEHHLVSACGLPLSLVGYFSPACGDLQSLPASLLYSLPLLLSYLISLHLEGKNNGRQDNKMSIYGVFFLCLSLFSHLISFCLCVILFVSG